MADSGVNGGIKLLQTVLAGQEYSSLLDRWAMPLEIEDDRGQLRVEITDESGKLNLNSIVFTNGEANEPFYSLVPRLCRNLKLPAELRDTAADWIDENDEPHPGGVETSYYQSLPIPYRAKNAAFDTFDELRMANGFDENPETPAYICHGIQ
jgi:general secretion pathway protein K